MYKRVLSKVGNGQDKWRLLHDSGCQVYLDLWEDLETITPDVVPLAHG